MVEKIDGYVVEQWMNQASVDRTIVVMQECIESSRGNEVLGLYIPIWEEYIAKYTTPHWQHIQSFDSIRGAMEHEKHLLRLDNKVLTRIIHAEISGCNGTNYTFISEFRRVKAAVGIEGN